MSRPFELVRAERLHCVVEAHDWAFDRLRGAEIDAHWDARQRANPALYDGPVLLAHHVERPSGDVLRVKFFETRFSRFLAWRDFGFPGEDVYNCFSMPALRSADGAFLLGEMGPRHSAAGAVYFPAGTPDLSDLREGVVDLEANLLRELEEETGIASAEATPQPEWTVVFAGPRIACMKIMHSAEPAATIKARVDRFIARQKEPELARAHMVASRGELAALRTLDFMRGFLEPLLPE